MNRHSKQGSDFVMDADERKAFAATLVATEPMGHLSAHQQHRGAHACSLMALTDYVYGPLCCMTAPYL